MGRQQIAADQIDPRAKAGEAFDEGFHLGPVLFSPDIQRPARCEKSARAQEVPRCRSQRENAGAAIGFFPERGRTPGGVVAGSILRFHDQHPRMRSKFGGKAGPCHAGTDDSEVEPFHPKCSCVS